MEVSLAVAARRERERNARRESILDAAQELIASGGYHGLRMDAVAEAVELSKGTLYLYFENKDALCAAVATRLIDVCLACLQDAIAEAQTGLDAVRALLLAYAEFAEEHPQHFRFALAWLSAGERMDDSTESFQTYRGRVGQVLALVVSAIGRGQQDGTIRPEINPLHQAIQIWASSLGVVLVRLNRETMAQRVPEPVDLEELVPLHVDSVARALAARGAS